MHKLVSGYRKFRTNVYPGHEEDFRRLAHGQQPGTLFITCSDSRIVPDMILQAGPGELFICRNAGNIVPAHGDQNGGVSATIEYAVSVLKVQDIVVCGHSDCGVMHGLLHPDRVEHLPNVKHWLQYGARARAVVDAVCDGQSDTQKVMEMGRQNVLAQLDNLRTHPSVAAARVKHGLRLHGWMYHIESGEIRTSSPETGEFVPLESQPIREPDLVLA